ncbi:hypothetical protein F4677DRAFT_362430 [Hypoxylon crocopeplum]|nr:hypothetical protein F4677DRAFT_362430 [Hypoxylon crocopeplum]
MELPQVESTSNTMNEHRTKELRFRHKVAATLSVFLLSAILMQLHLVHVLPNLHFGLTLNNWLSCLCIYVVNKACASLYCWLVDEKTGPWYIYYIPIPATMVAGLLVYWFRLSTSAPVRCVRYA